MQSRSDEPRVAPEGWLTDIPGVRVGQWQNNEDGWLSGVTVIIPPTGTVGSVDVRGGAPATHETDALAPGTLVSTVDAVVLTGGSAFGLATASGVQKWCEEQGRGFKAGSNPDAGLVVPIVPAAAIFDVGRGGDIALRPGANEGYAAALDADGGPFALGNAGAGMGALIDRGRFKGGLGTAAATIAIEGIDPQIQVAALAVVNAMGAPTQAQAPGTSLPESAESTQGNANTTLVVVVCTAKLDVAQAQRLAMAGQDGIARAISPAHTLVDGDTVFALATGAVPIPEAMSAAVQARLHAAGALVVEKAIFNGVRNAEPISTPACDVPGWGRS